MARVGRNEPCPCGSGRKAKRCCGVRGGPSEESLARAFLAHVSREAAWELRNVRGVEFEALLDGLTGLPALDLSLHVVLPKLVSPALDRFLEAFAENDPEAAEEPFGELLDAVDGPLERAPAGSRRDRVAGERQGRCEARRCGPDRSRKRLSWTARREPGSGVAVRAGAARTPGGILLAA